MITLCYNQETENNNQTYKEIHMEKYFKFTGVASRSEFWGVNIIAVIALSIIVLISTGFIAIASAGLGILLAVAASIAYTWCNLAVTVRRCRDAGINVWWTAACFIPYIGLITWIVIGCLSTNPQEQFQELN